VLVMNSGYVANEGLLSTIIETTDWVASDECNHASIIDGLRLCRAEKFVFAHNDLNQLAGGLARVAQLRPRDRQLFIVTESLFSMEGDRAPLLELAALAQRYGAHLIVDEAHATGCFGATGSGLVDGLGLRDRVLATVHTGGKALGVPGAYVCGSRQLKEILTNRCRQLIFTTALSPLIAHWWLDAQAQVQQDEAGRFQLRENTRRFRELLAASGITALGQDYIIPLILGPDRAAVQAAARLQKQGYDIRAVRPPTVPAGTSRLRISVHAHHDMDTLENVARLLTTAVQQAQNDNDR
jgi:7-keto-8-aminopelargonate synthetase-like enzyme